MSLPVPSSSRSGPRSEPGPASRPEVEAARASLRGKVKLRPPRKARLSSARWDLVKSNEWEALARTLVDRWQLQREAAADLRKAGESEAPDALVACLRKLQAHLLARVATAHPLRIHGGSALSDGPPPRVYADGFTIVERNGRFEVSSTCRRGRLVDDTSYGTLDAAVASLISAYAADEAAPRER